MAIRGLTFRGVALSSGGNSRHTSHIDKIGCCPARLAAIQMFEYAD